MADGIQTANGKAFEYACLIALYEMLCNEQQIVIEDTAPLYTAKKHYEQMDEILKQKLDKAASAAARVIVPLEPQLKYPGIHGPLYLTLQTDAQGQQGDVRDVLCLRRQNSWEVGLSCKHNHDAVKHSRLSDKIDFGKEWFDISCSENYFNEILPLFSELRDIRDTSKKSGAPALWSEIADKEDKYYIPILRAFIQELKRLDAENPNTIPKLLIHYLIGKNDFYKVITDDAKQYTRVEAININGSLNRSAEGRSSLAKVDKLKLPTRFYHVDFKPNSKNTIEVVCDEGWTVSMRIHNASSKIEPSLKFDVKLISLPGTIYAETEPWL